MTIYFSAPDNSPAHSNPFFRNNDSNHFIQNCRSCNGPLNDPGTCRCRPGQDRNGNPGKHQRYAGMGQKGKTKVFLHSGLHACDLCPKPCPKIFAEGTNDNVNKRIKTCAQNRMKIKGRPQIQDNDDHKDTQQRVKITNDLLQAFFCDHIGEGGRKRHAHQHEIQKRGGHKIRIAQISDKSRYKNHAKKNGQRLGLVYLLFQQFSRGKSCYKADQQGQQNHYGDHIQGHPIA